MKNIFFIIFSMFDIVLKSRPVWLYSVTSQDGIEWKMERKDQSISNDIHHDMTTAYNGLVTSYNDPTTSISVTTPS